MENESQEHKIYVGRLGRDLKEEDFLEAFGQFGEMIKWSFISERGYAYVSYRHKMDAENAIECMNGNYVGILPLQVEWAGSYWPRVCPEETIDRYDIIFNMTSWNNTSIRCQGLACYTTEKTLEDIFGAFGLVYGISLRFLSKGSVIIHFTTKEAATLAICSVDNTVIDGSLVSCTWYDKPNSHNGQFRIGAAALPEPSSVSNSYSAEIVESGLDFDKIFNETSPNHRTVHCTGLVNSVTIEIIEYIFSRFGKIEDILLYNQKSDFGFIRFNTKEAGALAIYNIDRTLIKGSIVRCSWSHRTEDSSSSSTELQQSSESSPESRLDSLTGMMDRLNMVSRLVPTDVPGASSATLTEEESQGAAKPEEINPDTLCKICMNEELGMVYLPCGHLYSCAKCTLLITSCLVCRKKITREVWTYLS